jgi:probable phosphoglycerate mutase
VTGQRAELLLVRHGRTAWHSPNRYTGRSDIDLDEVGRAQAKALGEWSRSAGIAALYSSPMARTRTTAAPVSAATGLAVQERAALREIDFGVAEGRTIDQMAVNDAAATQAFLADPVEGHWPDGDEPRSRTEDAITELATIAHAYPGARVMVVAHSTLLRLALCHLLGIPLAHYRYALARPQPTAVSVIRWDGTSNATLESFNVSVINAKAAGEGR